MRIKLIIALISLVLLVSFPPHPTLLFAQFADCITNASGAEATGLVTAPQLDRNLIVSPSGRCIADPATSFAPFKIPKFDDLKSLYYDQKKTGTQEFTGSLPTLSDQTVYSKNGDLSLTNTPSINGTAVVFIKGNLSIGAIAGNKFTYSAASGIVFVVSGNVYIDKTITQVDALIISEGIIYTASDNSVVPPASCLRDSVDTIDGTNPINVLTINGSLVSLNQSQTVLDRATRPIELCRSLQDNTTAAEIINFQPKYLVNLRGMFADSLQKYSELIGTYAPPPAPTTANAYKDEDGDGYTVGAAQQVALVNGQLPAGWVATSQGTDCYDKNADAKPGQTLYFSAKRGRDNDSDGNSGNSYDYNCSGNDEYSPNSPTTCGESGSMTRGDLCALGLCGGRYSVCDYEDSYFRCLGNRGDQLCH